MLRSDGTALALTPRQFDALLLFVENAGQLLQKDTLMRALWLAVAKLNERCQRLLRIIAFHDRPDYTALSAELGMPVGSIGPTRGRCLEKMRASTLKKKDSEAIVTEAELNKALDPRAMTEPEKM